MDAGAELEPGEPGRGGLIGPWVAGGRAGPENLFQDAAEGECRREVNCAGEPLYVVPGELAAAEAGEQLGCGGLRGPVPALELQAAGKVPYPGRDQGERAVVPAQRGEQKRAEDIAERIVADAGDGVAGGVVDWAERGGQRVIEQLTGAEQASHACLRAGQ